MADLATLQARLAEAETARHQLRIGAKTQSVTTESGAVVYTPAKASELDAYIIGLKFEISQLSGVPMRRHFIPGFGR